MRSYILTDTELDAINDYIKTRKRTPTINKILHYVHHNQCLWIDIQLFLELKRIAHHKPDKSRAKRIA